MTDRKDFEAGQAHWCRVLGKPEPSSADARKSQDQRILEWGAKCRAEAAAADATKTFGTQARRFPSSHAVGERRTAMDGTLWQRVS